MSEPIYSFLDASRREIRLLRISPSPITSRPIFTRLFIVSLDNEPKYHALSYVWGDPGVTRPISLNYVPVRVTANLDAALRRLRRPDAYAVCWVDALCINQADLAERASQVTLMGDVYRGASLVRAWVGPADANSDAALDAIDAWTAGMDRPLSSFAGGDSTDLIDYVYSETLKTDVNATIDGLRRGRMMEPLTEFFGSQTPYWERVWIMQELLLAKDARVTCGEREIGFHRIVYFHKKWSILKRIAEGMERAGETPWVAHLIYQPPSVLVALTRDRSLFGLTNFSRACQATDPRDKLFGLLGLAQSATYTPEVDYTKSAAQVYVDFTRAYQKATGRLLIDGSSGIGAKSYKDDTIIPGLPSWAYNLTRSLAFPINGAGAGTNFKAIVRDTDEPMVLETQGVIVDYIVDHVCQSKGDKEYLKAAQFVLDHIEGQHPTGIPLAQAFFRILGGFDKPEVDKSSLGADDFYRRATGFILWLSKRTKQLGQAHPKWDEYCDAFVTEFGNEYDFNVLLNEMSNHTLCFLECTGLIDHLYEPSQRLGGLQALLIMEQEELLAGFCGSKGGDVLPWRDLYYKEDDSNFHLFLNSLIFGFHLEKSLFISQLGYVGLGPQGTCDGDEICVLPGCEYPLVLRKTGNDYQVVGSCRAYGLIDGEVMKKLDKGEVELTDLRII